MWFENTIESRWLLILDNADSLESYDHISPPRSKSLVMKVRDWSQQHSPRALKFKSKKVTGIEIDDSHSIVARNTLMNTSNVESRRFKALSTLIPKGNGGCVLV